MEISHLHDLLERWLSLWEYDTHGGERWQHTKSASISVAVCPAQQLTAVGIKWILNFVLRDTH